MVESSHLEEKFTVQDLGILHPHEVSVDVLCAGQVGYVVLGMRDVKKALVGDTFFHLKKPVLAVEGTHMFYPDHPVRQSQSCNFIG